MTTVSRAAQFAQRTAHLRASTIREMLKVTQQPDVISFGGGLPAPELFPTEAIARATERVMERLGSAALQYSVTEGIPEMRIWVAERLTRRCGSIFSAEAVQIVNGSQQGLDLVGKIFLDPGDHVVLEDPSYLGAIQAFDAYQTRYLTVETDDDGLIPESLEQVLERADPFPKFLYLVPNFQNPTGRTLSGRRRESVVRICEHFGLPIVEDDPYGELRFEGTDLPPLLSYRSSAPIIYSGTGSKIMAPGMRIAWLVVQDEAIREKIVLAKQGADLHSGTFAQYVFHEYVSDGDAFDAHVRRIAQTYAHRRGVMAEALADFMPEGVRFTRPAGGMFLWVTVPNVD
ncbi:MAG: PLP-dependent aminotransferase family protein, partial [Candidatus Eremiobacteraeota bacterium]|nr:PLP-dependent aminotransferase family protein [Candidatus Eremiobacteraeota bacterium]